MPGILVIGYGNSLRGDDGFGRCAAELVAQRRVAGLEVIVAHQLGPEMAAALATADRAVFLDAEAADDPDEAAAANLSGTLRATAIEPRAMSPAAISHQFSPATLLALTMTAYGRAPAATLLTATACRFEHGADLSAEVRTAAKAAADLVVTLAENGRLDTDAVRAALTPPA